jgi:hypothetical protein
MVMDILRCVADGSGGWKVYLATNGSHFGLAPFTKVIEFYLGNALAPRWGGQYRRGLPVPVSTMRHGTDFDPLVDFTRDDIFFSNCRSICHKNLISYTSYKKKKGLHIFAIINY